MLIAISFWNILKFLFHIGVELVNNIELALSVQQSDSVIYIQVKC